MTRPEDLLYTVGELPPWPRLLFLGMQHAMLMSVYLVLIVIVFRHAGASYAATLNALSFGMIALAASTVLQSIWKGPVGSGYLAPPVFSAIYIGPAVLAASTGGLPAVFGMTMFAGLVEISLAPLLSRLRALFPPAISGLIVVIVGLQLGVIGVGDLLGEVRTGLDAPHIYEHRKSYSTPAITSADGLCITRILSPIRQALPVERYEMVLKPGGSLRANAHGNGSWEHQTVIAGRVIIEIGDSEVLLEQGDTLRYSAEQPHGIRNAGDTEARVMLVVLSLKEIQYVEAARGLGASHKRLMFRHILPQCVAPYLILATTHLGVAIVIEASLGFLGVGIPPPSPTWGNMLSDALNAGLVPPWWLVLFPGVAITLTVLAFNLLGDGIRDMLDPRLRGSV